MNDDEKATWNVIASMKARPSIRHVEKRRTSTCQFADRIAKLSIGHYRKIVPKKHQGTSTCLATVVAHDRQTDCFLILGNNIFDHTIKWYRLRLICMRTQLTSQKCRLLGLFGSVKQRSSCRSLLAVWHAHACHTTTALGCKGGPAFCVTCCFFCGHDYQLDVCSFHKTKAKQSNKILRPR